MNQTKFHETIREKLIREQMVEGLIKNNCLVTPDVIEAFKRIPRHAFVDKALRIRAYQDTRLPIGCEQTISKPSTVAVMTEILDIKPEHRVLEIGTGCGYQTAILALLAKKVYSVEWHPQLVQFARTTLKSLGFPTVRIEQGDGSQGWPSAAPFDRIIFTAGAPSIPEDVCYQLCDSGIMIVPSGPRQAQKLLKIKRTDTKDDVIFDVSEHGVCEFVDLVGRNGW